MNSKYVIVNKRRFFSVVCVLLLLILTLMSIVIIPQNISSKSIDVNTVYVVKDGDRLWDIASKARTDEDIRSVIRNIRIVNDISSDEYIYPGQKLNIPYILQL